MEKKVGFNLLRPQLAPEDKWDSIYEWVNNTARIIVIFVEIVVIGCFVTRVIVDSQARDLEEVLDDNKNQLDNLRDTEQEIMKVQKNVLVYSNVWKNSTNLSQVLGEIYSYNPSLFQNFSVSLDEEGKLSITGVAQKTEIGELERTMKNSDTFSQVELTSFKPGGEGQNEPGEFNIAAVVASYTRDPLMASMEVESSEEDV
ncbi:hypothetical protein GF362_01295 [Candidatus Dojkabacteria bacterium]|nr:hypothetical protein [Candidatus Dojkabacteria bacterium]